MMPGLDGFGLLRELRVDPATQTLPVILLSARAGEESTAEGLQAGANDYLIKPFSARELLARVSSQLTIAALRQAAERERSTQLKAMAEEVRRRSEAEETLVALHEELSHRSEERFQLLVDSVTDYAIFMLDPTGRVATWNAGAHKTKGYRAEEIVGRHFSVFYTPEDRAVGKPERILEIVRREGRFEDESWRVRKDGSRFWADVIITALRDKGGGVLGFAKVTRDLTERRKAEENAAARRELESVNRAKDDFLAVMGHELRNPLAPMLTAVHLIKLRRGVQCEREIGVLERQLVQMMRLLDDVLDVSRLVRNRVELSKKPMEIGEVIANAVDVSAQLIEQRRHLLRLDVPAESLVVNVNSDRITQVFGNLLNNAAKYTDDGGEIRVRAESDGDKVTVTIEDTGIGIAPDVLPRIFELFVQGEQAKERQLGGFGVGLSVAQKLVFEHGGSIRAESDGLRRGSRFIVSLPRSVVAVNLPRPALPSMRRAPVRRRVLIVNDNKDSAEMIGELLDQLGHEVRIALDGTSALELSQEFKPDIAFLDIGLPGMNGFELARRMRQIPACATIPMIAISGYARENRPPRGTNGRLYGTFLEADRPYAAGAPRRGRGAPSALSLERREVHALRKPGLKVRPLACGAREVAEEPQGPHAKRQFLLFERPVGIPRLVGIEGCERPLAVPLLNARARHPNGLELLGNRGAGRFGGGFGGALRRNRTGIDRGARAGRRRHGLGRGASLVCGARRGRLYREGRGGRRPRLDERRLGRCVRASSGSHCTGDTGGTRERSRGRTMRHHERRFALRHSALDRALMLAACHVARTSRHRRDKHADAGLRKSYLFEARERLGKRRPNDPRFDARRLRRSACAAEAEASEVRSSQRADVMVRTPVSVVSVPSYLSPARRIRTEKRHGRFGLGARAISAPRSS